MKKKVFLKGVLPLLTGAVSAISLSAIAQNLPADPQAAQLADAMAGTAGEYDEVNLDYIHSLGMQQKAWNNPLAHMGAGQTKPGYSKYNWTPDTVLPVRVREGMMTLINLPAWELIENAHIGSPESFYGKVVAPNSIMIYAEPSYIGVDSNMILFGRSGNRYVFYLRSETFNTDKITQSVVDVLVGPRWTPVADGGQMREGNGTSTMASMPTINLAGGFSTGTSGSVANASVAQNIADEWKNSVPMDPESLKFDLDMFLPNPDDVDIAPDNIWRDNIFTYIDLGPKALTMTQRPVVSLLVQDTEVPVGFRTRGANSRLIVVEAIGDLVLRNGQKVICIKLRRDPAAGLEYTDYSGFNEKPYAYLQQLPSRSGDMPNPEVTLNNGSMLHGSSPYVSAQNGGGVVNAGYATETGGLNPYATPSYAMPSYCADTTGANRCAAGGTWQDIRPIPESAVNYAPAYAGVEAATADRGTVLPVAVNETIALEFGTAPDIADLEKLWEQVYAANADILSGYDPYYSVDASANGEMADLFRLRAGTVKDAETGDALCRKLGRRGYSCSVVRIK